MCLIWAGHFSKRIKCIISIFIITVFCGWLLLAIYLFIFKVSLYLLFFKSTYLFGSIGSQLWHVGSCVAARGLLSSCGPWAQLSCSTWDLSSSTKDQTCVPCIGKWILNHWTTRDLCHQHLKGKKAEAQRGKTMSGDRVGLGSNYTASFQAFNNHTLLPSNMLLLLLSHFSRV